MADKNTVTQVNSLNKNIPERDSDLKHSSPRYEKFSAILLLVAGFVYLALWLISIFSETTPSIYITDDKVSMKMSELLSHIRTLITIGLALGGGFLILRRKPAGWVMGMVVLILLLVISSGTVYQSLKLEEPALIAIAATCWLIILLSIILLILPATRRKFRLNQANIITASILSLVLAMFYFFVQ